MSALRLGFVALAVGLAPAAAAQTDVPREPSLAVQDRAPADTLRYSVRAGSTLIVALPARRAGTAVTYEVVEAPALSWLVDRSFMWRTLESERGTLPIRLRRLAPGLAAEPVVLLVSIEG